MSTCYGRACDEIDAIKTQVAALTAQRDALLAACRAARDIPRWTNLATLDRMDGRQDAHYAINAILDQLAAAITTTEDA